MATHPAPPAAAHHHTAEAMVATLNLALAPSRHMVDLLQSHRTAVRLRRIPLGQPPAIRPARPPLVPAARAPVAFRATPPTRRFAPRPPMARRTPRCTPTLRPSALSPLPLARSELVHTALGTRAVRTEMAPLRLWGQLEPVRLARVPLALAPALPSLSLRAVRRSQLNALRARAK